MQIKSETWSIKELIQLKNKINPKPQYQRTSVWNPQKKKLLIDSILRGYDIPKFYLRETPADLSYKYEVTDGQQRIRAIWEFVDDNDSVNYTLNDALINGFNTKGVKFKSLKSNNDKTLLNHFLNYKLHVSIIDNTTPEEIRSLFARLQMGERLNPVELRHALASNIGTAINSIVENHPFFDNDCKISNSRYKHQDYLDNVVCLCNYDGKRSIKAVDMRQLYIDKANSTLAELQPLMKKTNDVLDTLKKINSYKKGIFKNKWAFVDMFYLLYNNYDKIKTIKASKIADDFVKFENLRRKYNAQPEQLIEDKTSLIYDKDLYDYIIAFKTSGAEINNIKIRHRVFTNKFLN
ncbi:DUF262 domain-containing protein [Flavobacterium sp. MK4S-17]|uniref:DUF262 domain-containing protein n=1 Tax=Flavobacterium sp. MK4S-17 TaxID=2543737 RepID=UPI001357E406|nr:DUF262 domain-containing protein [Flavobacterium sp. MK4S-17]